MRVNGIWRVEMLGIDGWEAAGAEFFENGRYLRASTHSYTVGQYELDGDQVVITATSTRFGGTRVVYGKGSGEVQLRVRGKVEDDAITAESTDGTHVTRFQATRVAEMP